MAATNANNYNYTNNDYSPVSLTHPGNNINDDVDRANSPPSIDHGDNPRSDSFSLHSRAPLAPRVRMEPMPTGPSMPVPNAPAMGRPPLSQSSSGLTHRAGNSSWDLLSGIRKDYEGFDTRNATESHLQFAQGDVPNNKVRA